MSTRRRWQWRWVRRQGTGVPVGEDAVTNFAKSFRQAARGAVCGMHSIPTRLRSHDVASCDRDGSSPTVVQFPNARRIVPSRASRSHGPRMDVCRLDTLGQVTAVNERVWIGSERIIDRYFPTAAQFLTQAAPVPAEARHKCVNRRRRAITCASPRGNRVSRFTLSRLRFVRGVCPAGALPSPSGKGGCRRVIAPTMRSSTGDRGHGPMYLAVVPPSELTGSVAPA